MANSDNSNSKFSSLKLGTQMFGKGTTQVEAKVPLTTYSIFGLSNSNIRLWAASSVTNTSMKQGGTRNGVSNNIWEMKDHGNLETEINERGRQRQESETRGKQG